MFRVNHLQFWEPYNCVNNWNKSIQNYSGEIIAWGVLRVNRRNLTFSHCKNQQVKFTSTIEGKKFFLIISEDLWWQDADVSRQKLWWQKVFISYFFFGMCTRKYVCERTCLCPRWLIKTCEAFSRALTLKSPFIHLVVERGRQFQSFYISEFPYSRDKVTGNFVDLHHVGFDAPRRHHMLVHILAKVVPSLTLTGNRKFRGINYLIM